MRTPGRSDAEMMVLSSSAFEDGQEIPEKHGKKIANVSPPLSWEAAPRATRSFALSVVDRHPVAGNYVHWLVVDIGAEVTSLPEAAAGAAMPAGSREVSPYAGPFPPSGTHDYEFTLYALKTDRLDLPGKVSLEAFTKAVEPDGQPVGSLMAFVRRFLHAVDALPCFIGLLFPLWDIRRQTLADKLARTVVLYDG
jgi:Raf kinase inhibitor-like YbhB/YbcL family protein